MTITETPYTMNYRYDKKLLLALLALTTSGFADELANDFVSPPASARPWFFWFPANDNLTKEGITVAVMANLEPQQVDAVAEFRVTGKQAELWWPDTGPTEQAKCFEIKDGITRVSFRLEPNGSVFVIFCQPTKSTQGNGKNWVETSPVQEITGPWRVTLDPKWGGPAQSGMFHKLLDWSKNQDAGIKDYSDHATYRTKFHAKRGHFLLDLEKVAVMAELTLNGKPLGLLWKPPFRMNVSDALKDGENPLEINVVNLWINRMIGDEHLQEGSDSNPNGMVKVWPQWLQEGKSKPWGTIDLHDHTTLEERRSARRIRTAWSGDNSIQGGCNIDPMRNEIPLLTRL